MHLIAMKPLQFSKNTSERMHSLQTDKLMILTPMELFIIVETNTTSFSFKITRG